MGRFAVNQTPSQRSSGGISRASVTSGFSAEFTRRDKERNLSTGRRVNEAALARAKRYTVMKSPETDRAEDAAKSLVNDLQSMGYDVDAGILSIDTTSIDDAERYMTDVGEEREARGTDRLQTVPEDRDDDTVSFNGRREAGASYYDSGSFDPSTRYTYNTESYTASDMEPQETSDWTAAKSTVLSSRETNDWSRPSEASSSNDGNWTTKDNDWEKSYTDSRDTEEQTRYTRDTENQTTYTRDTKYTSMNEHEPRIISPKKALASKLKKSKKDDDSESTYSSAPATSATTSSSFSAVAEDKFEKLIDESFDESIDTNTFSRFLGVSKRRRRNRSRKNKDGVRQVKSSKVSESPSIPSDIIKVKSSESIRERLARGGGLVTPKASNKSKSNEVSRESSSVTENDSMDVSLSQKLREEPVGNHVGSAPSNSNAEERYANILEGSSRNGSDSPEETIMRQPRPSFDNTTVPDAEASASIEGSQGALDKSDRAILHGDSSMNAGASATLESIDDTHGLPVAVPVGAEAEDPPGTKKFKRRFLGRFSSAGKEKSTSNADYIDEEGIEEYKGNRKSESKGILGRLQLKRPRMTSSSPDGSEIMASNSTGESRTREADDYQNGLGGSIPSDSRNESIAPEIIDQNRSKYTQDETSSRMIGDSKEPINWNADSTARKRKENEAGSDVVDSRNSSARKQGRTMSVYSETSANESEASVKGISKGAKVTSDDIGRKVSSPRRPVSRSSSPRKNGRAQSSPRQKSTEKSPRQEDGRLSTSREKQSTGALSRFTSADIPSHSAAGVSSNRATVGSLSSGTQNHQAIDDNGLSEDPSSERDRHENDKVHRADVTGEDWRLVTRKEFFGDTLAHSVERARRAKIARKKGFLRRFLGRSRTPGAPQLQRSRSVENIPWSTGTSWSLVSRESECMSDNAYEYDSAEGQDIYQDGGRHSFWKTSHPQKEMGGQEASDAASIASDDSSHMSSDADKRSRSSHQSWAIKTVSSKEISKASRKTNSTTNMSISTEASSSVMLNPLIGGGRGKSGSTANDAKRSESATNEPGSIASRDASSTRSIDLLRAEPAKSSKKPKGVWKYARPRRVPSPKKAIRGLLRVGSPRHQSEASTIEVTENGILEDSEMCYYGRPTSPRSLSPRKRPARFLRSFSPRSPRSESSFNFDDVDTSSKPKSAKSKSSNPKPEKNDNMTVATAETGGVGSRGTCLDTNTSKSSSRKSQTRVSPPKQKGKQGKSTVKWIIKFLKRGASKRENPAERETVDEDELPRSDKADESLVSLQEFQASLQSNSSITTFQINDLSVEAFHKTSSYGGYDNMGEHQPWEGADEGVEKDDVDVDNVESVKVNDGISLLHGPSSPKGKGSVNNDIKYLDSDLCVSSAHQTADPAGVIKSPFDNDSDLTIAPAENNPITEVITQSERVAVVTMEQSVPMEPEGRAPLQMETVECQVESEMPQMESDAPKVESETPRVESKKPQIETEEPRMETSRRRTKSLTQAAADGIASFLGIRRGNKSSKSASKSIAAAVDDFGTEPNAKVGGKATTERALVALPRVEAKEEVEVEAEPKQSVSATPSSRNNDHSVDKSRSQLLEQNDLLLALEYSGSSTEKLSQGASDSASTNTDGAIASSDMASTGLGQSRLVSPNRLQNKNTTVVEYAGCGAAGDYGCQQGLGQQVIDEKKGVRFSDDLVLVREFETTTALSKNPTESKEEEPQHQNKLNFNKVLFAWLQRDARATQQETQLFPFQDDVKNDHANIAPRGVTGINETESSTDRRPHQHASNLPKQKNSGKMAIEGVEQTSATDSAGRDDYSVRDGVGDVSTTSETGEPAAQAAKKNQKIVAKARTGQVIQHGTTLSSESASYISSDISSFTGLNPIDPEEMSRRSNVISMAGRRKNGLSQRQIAEIMRHRRRENHESLPQEEEGIELIARRTKNGKNAILIARSGKLRQKTRSGPQPMQAGRNSARKMGKAGEFMKSFSNKRSKNKKLRQQPKEKFKLRLLPMITGKGSRKSQKNRGQTPAPERNRMATVPRDSAMKQRNAMRTHTAYSNRGASTGPAIRSNDVYSLASSTISKGNTTRASMTSTLPSLSEKQVPQNYKTMMYDSASSKQTQNENDHIASMNKNTHEPAPILRKSKRHHIQDDAHIDTVRCPVGRRADKMNQNQNHVASGHADAASGQSGYSKNGIANFNPGSESVSSSTNAGDLSTFGEQSTNFDLSTRNGQTYQGSTGSSIGTTEWYTWWMPSGWQQGPELPPNKVKNASREKKSLRNLTMNSSRDGGVSRVSSFTSRNIEEDTWQDILDVTETLATRYREQQTSDLDDDRSDRSISDETIKEVNDAIAKFREHAARLGVDERRLMAAVRDDDKSFQSVTRIDSYTTNETPRTNGDFVSRVGNATDRFIDMFEYYFSQNDADSTVAGSR